MSTSSLPCKQCEFAVTKCPRWCPVIKRSQEVAQ